MKDLLLQVRIVVEPQVQTTSSRSLADYTSKYFTKKRATRAARLFVFTQPIKSLICGVVVAAPVVIS